MRVVITVFHSLVSRNLLYESVLDKLRESGVEVVLLVPKLKEDHFQKLLGQKGIKVVAIDTAELVSHPRNIFLQRLAFLLIRSHYLWYKQAERRDARGGVKAWLKYILERIFVLLFAHPYSRAPFRALFRRYADLGRLRKIIGELSPALVVSTDAFSLADSLVMRAAQAEGAHALSMVRSWDNCYSKGLLPVVPGSMLTNTGLLKQEAHDIHGVPLERIEVIGLPQMDAFFNPPAFDRAAFMRKIGADPEAKLVVFAPGGSVLTDIDWQTCEMLRDALDGGAIAGKVHVLVRNHPHHPADLSRLVADPRFTVELPGQVMDGNTKNTELLPNDQNHLRETLQAADVVLWVATTLGIDAAALNRPQIMVNFDGYEQRPYLQSVRKYHDEDHMKKLVATGGAHVARSREEMIEWINKYLEKPSLDSEKRQKIIDTQLVYADGRSGDRFARAVISAASGAKAG